MVDRWRIDGGSIDGGSMADLSMADRWRIDGGSMADLSMADRSIPPLRNREPNLAKDLKRIGNQHKDSFSEGGNSFSDPLSAPDVFPFPRVLMEKLLGQCVGGGGGGGGDIFFSFPPPPRLSVSR
jgi:hypothetical protein